MHLFINYIDAKSDKKIDENCYYFMKISEYVYLNRDPST